MANILGGLADRAVGLLVRPGTIGAVEDVAASFRRVEIRVDLPAGVWAPGAKVQFRIRGATFRTFTPFAWADGSVSFLLHRHGGVGPAVAWADGLDVGSGVQMFGPRRSLSLAGLDAGPVVVGDETSLALAAAWAIDGTRSATAHVLEATTPGEVDAVAAGLGLGSVEVVQRRPDDAHHPDLAVRVVDVLAAHAGAPLVATGKAQTIKAVRAAVKAAGLSPPARVKAYWDPNRAGLD
ncbi:MAG: siderophore-interacting protein [Acidimicrobiia bacterium]